MNDESIFAEVIARPLEERADFLDEACGEDRGLRERVEELLRSHDEAGSFLANPVRQELDGTLDFSAEDHDRLEERLESVRKSQPHRQPEDGETPGVLVKQGEDGNRVLYFGDYVLEGEIARGAMGVVYRARQESLKRTVAIKMIRSTMLTSGDDVARFHAEAESAASLDHPNIVPIYEVGIHEEQHYFSMKLIEGGTLRDHLARLKLAPKEGAKLMSTVAGAIHAAHQRQILHRDLKPGNILIDEEGEPHVTDFGLAKQMESASSMTLSGQIMGTPNYMAPEQAEGGGKDVTTGADVYALGAILYEMLCGRPPHEGESLMDTLRMVAEEEPARPRKHYPKVDRDLETIACKCLEKDPAKRYHSAQSLKNELDRWLRGEPIRARPVGTAEKVIKWMKRKPMHAAAAAVTLLFLLTLGIGGPIAALRQAELRGKAEVAEGVAIEAQALAGAEARKTREALYAADMQLAAQFWESDTDSAGAVDRILSGYIPIGEEEDLRNFAWRYQWHQLHRSGLFSRSFAEQQSLAFTSSGSLLTCDRGKKIREWRIGVDEPIRAVQLPIAGKALTSRFSPDGEKIAVSNEKGLARVFDTGSGREWQGPIEDFKTQSRSAELLTSLSKDSSKAHFVAWTPNGKMAASGDSSGKVTLWDTDSRTEIRTLSCHSSSVVQILFSPDGRRLATGGGDGLVRVWKIPVGQLEFQFKGHLTSVQEFAFSANGSHLASGDASGGVRVWNMSAQHSSSLLVEDDSVDFQFFRIACSPDGNWLAAGGAKPALWNLDKGGPPRRFDSVSSTVAFSSDSEILARSNGKGEIEFWDLRDGRQVESWKVGSFVSHCAFSRDGRFLAAGEGKPYFGSSESRHIKIWDLELARETRRLSYHTKPAAHVQFSPDSNLLASAGRDGTVALWDTSDWTLQRVLRGTGTAFYSVAFSPDGSVVAAGDTEGSIYLWRTASGELIGSLDGHESMVVALEFLPDGKTLASGSSDQTMKLWNLTGGLATRTFRGHTDWVNGIVVMPEGNALATASTDGSVRLWEASSFEEIDEDLATLKSLYRRGEKDNRRGNYRKAEQIFRKTTEAQRRVLGEDHPDTLRSLKEVGTALDNQKNYSEAAATWEETLELELKAEGDGSFAQELIDHILLAYQKEADRLRDAGDPESVAQVYRTALDNARQLLGPEQVVVAAYQFHLARALHQIGARDEALQYFEKSLALRRKLLSPDDIQLSDSMHGVAVRLMEGGDEKRAGLLLREALPIRRKHKETDPEGLNETLRALANAMLRSGSAEAIEEAETMLLESFSLDTDKGHKVQSAETLAKLHARRSQPRLALKWRAHAAFEAERYGEALSRYREVLALEERDLGADHEDTLATKETIRQSRLFLLTSHGRERRFEEAATLLGEFLAAHPKDRYRARQLAVCHLHSGRIEDYKAVCIDLLDREVFAASWDLEQTARIYLLLDRPPDSRFLDAGVELSRKALKASPNNKWAQMVTGLAEFRSRRYAQADYWLKRASVGSDPLLGSIASSLQAMSQFRQGQTKAAALLAANAESLFIEQAKEKDRWWSEVLIAELLLKEMETVLSGIGTAPGQLRPARQYPVTTDPIPARPSNALLNQVDLSGYYNAALTQPWHDRNSNHQIHLGTLPRGLQTFDGVTFDVRGIVQLAGGATCENLLDYPGAVRGIPVKGAWDKLHFLHSLGWGSSATETVGRFVIHFSDGPSEEFDLVQGQHVSDWWVRDRDPGLTDPATTIGWQGKTPAGPQVRLFHTVWNNPYPETQIVSIDYVSDLAFAAPFLVAVTAE